MVKKIKIKKKQQKTEKKKRLAQKQTEKMEKKNLGGPFVEDHSHHTVRASYPAEKKLQAWSGRRGWREVEIEPQN